MLHNSLLYTGITFPHSERKLPSGFLPWWSHPGVLRFWLARAANSRFRALFLREWWTPSKRKRRCTSLIAWKSSSSQLLLAHIMGVLLVTIVTRSYHRSHKKVSLPYTIETSHFHTFPHISSSTLGSESVLEKGWKTVLRPLCRDGSMLQLLSSFLHFLLF